MNNRLKYSLIAGVIAAELLFISFGQWTSLPSAPVSVTAFGAACDGSTVDTTPIQNALNLAGLTVTLPAGKTCIVNADLVIKSGQTLRGAGPGASIKLASGSTSVTNIIKVDNVNNVKLEDFTIDGNNVVFTTGTDGALHIFSSTNITVDNVNIQNIAVSGSSNTQKGVYVFNTSGTLRDSHTEAVAGIAVFLNTNLPFTIVNNWIDNSFQGGIYGQHSGSISNMPITIEGNIITNTFDSAGSSGSTGNAIDIFLGSGVVIANNTATNSNRSGIRVASSTNVVVTGNKVHYPGDNGIYMEFSSQNNTVTSNQVDGSYGSGIVVENGLDTANWSTSVVGNQVYDSQGNPAKQVGAGILCERGCTISGNTVNGAYFGIVPGNGNTGHSFTDNKLSGFGINVTGNVVEELRPYIYTCSSSSGTFATADVLYVGSTYATATKTGIVTTAGFTAGVASFVNGQLALGDVITNNSESGSCTVGTLGPYFAQLLGVSGGTFANGDTVYVGASFGAATKIGVITAIATDFQGTSLYTMNFTTGSFVQGDVLKDNTSGAVSTGGWVWGVGEYMSVGIGANFLDQNPTPEISITNNEIMGASTAAIAALGNASTSTYTLGPSTTASGNLGVSSADRTTYMSAPGLGSVNTDVDTGITWIYGLNGWANIAPQHQEYWNVQSALFSTTTALGSVYYEGNTATLKRITARLSGTISCTVAPTINILDLGASPTTAYGSATSLATLATATSDGAVASGALSVAITAGHYIGMGFSAGTCITAPTIDITVAVQ